MFCTNCGKQLSSDNNFCPNCGKKTNNQTASTAYTQYASDEQISAGFGGDPQQTEQFNPYPYVLTQFVRQKTADYYANRSLILACLGFFALMLNTFFAFGFALWGLTDCVKLKNHSNKLVCVIANATLLAVCGALVFASLILQIFG